MWYRHKGEKKWIRISHRKFFSDNPAFAESYRKGHIEIKHQPRSQKQIEQWNRFRTLGDLSRTLAGMRELVRNPLIQFTKTELDIHYAYVNKLKREFNQIRTGESI